MNELQLQWYPGHMTKARRAMQEDIKLVDLVIELLDARVPLASRNPDINRIAANKARMILLNKADLADPKENKRWASYFEAQGAVTVCLDSRSKGQMKQVIAAVMKACQAKIERDRKRGIKERPIRAMVVGIPNVGKSTFINSFSGKSVAKTGNKPGVTKGTQWIRIDKQVELLDTPGILWPKFESAWVGTHLAYIGSINDEIIPLEELACSLLLTLKESNVEAITSRFNIEISDEDSAYELLEKIGVCRGCLKKQGVIDTERAARLLLDDFRSGKMGRISIEKAQ